jgi:2-dehydro-3-deoxygalactonokinase
VVATARRPVGVRDAALAASGSRALANAVHDTIAEVLRAGGGVRPDAVVASGMLTSESGLCAVPHVAAPAGVDDLAAGAVRIDLPEVGPWPILFVPGVKTPPDDGPAGWTAADVMRGEECETLGALELVSAEGRAAFLWPGSHTKLVAVDDQGRISRSFTTLAGEMTTAIARHTLIAASLPESLPPDPDPELVALGGLVAEREGIGRCAFLVRVAALSERLNATQRAAFWVGSVIGDDAARLARHPILDGGVPLWVGGAPTLRRVYAQALARLRGGVTSLSDSDADRVAALGALAVARRCQQRRG